MTRACKITALVLALVMVLTMVGCSSGSTSTGASTGSTSGTAENRDPVTVKWWYPMHVDNVEEDFSSDCVLEVLIREKTGVSIEWELVPATNQAERYNLLMAAGDLPDIVTEDPVDLKKYTDAWAPLDDYVLGNERYSNLEATIWGDEFLTTYLPSDDGKIRILPMLATRLIGDMILVRGDLMEAWGYEDIVTVDDWHEVLTKAKDEGYIPYMTRKTRAGIVYRLFGGYTDCMQEEYYVDPDGVTVKYGALEPRFKEMIEIARQWYAEGLLDPEYPTTDATIWWENVLGGKVFATHDNITRIGSANQDFMENQGVDYRLVGLAPMESPETGTRNTTIHYPRVRDKSGCLAASSKNIERALDMFDFIYSEEGFIPTNWGTEGYSYELVDGKPVMLDSYNQGRKDKSILPWFGHADFPKNQADELIYNYNIYDYHKEILVARDLYEEGSYIRRNLIEAISFTDAETESMQAREAELDTYRGEMLDRFIMGTEPMENWDAFVQQLIKMGVEENLAVYQAGLDRALGK